MLTSDYTYYSLAMEGYQYFTTAIQEMKGPQNTDKFNHSIQTQQDRAFLVKC